MEEKVIYDGFFFDHESIEKLREILYIINENCFHRFYPLNIYYWARISHGEVLAMSTYDGSKTNQAVN